MYHDALDSTRISGVQSISAAGGAAIGDETSAGTGKGTGRAMNGLLWIAQILLAGIFLFTGAGKLFAYQRVLQRVQARSKGRPAGVSRGLAAFIGLAEIAGALGVVAPVDLYPPHVLLRLAAAGLALIMVFAGIYHLRRQESAAPSVTLFLLALFVIVGRWPR
jgi:uncharacterized membrane protein YphA (DoxX/SURF4 family)